MSKIERLFGTIGGSRVGTIGSYQVYDAQVNVTHLSEAQAELLDLRGEMREITDRVIAAETLLVEIRDGKHSLPGTLIQIKRLLGDGGAPPAPVPGNYAECNCATSSPGAFRDSSYGHVVHHADCPFYETRP